MKSECKADAGKPQLAYLPPAWNARIMECNGWVSLVPFFWAVHNRAFLDEPLTYTALKCALRSDLHSEADAALIMEWAATHGGYEAHSYDRAANGLVRYLSAFLRHCRSRPDDIDAHSGFRHRQHNSANVGILWQLGQ